MTRLATATVAIVICSGLLKLAEPLGGDQSLFLIGAHALHDGAQLYRDFWDLKQPGIYTFYYLATFAGSYDATTIHVFELGYLSVFSIVLMWGLAQSPLLSRIASIAPLGAVAFYYLAASSFEAIQVESLVGFPLFVALLAFALGERESQVKQKFLYFFAGGVATAIVLAFKLIFAPIIAAIWIVVVGTHWRLSLSPLSLVSALAGTILGIALPWAAIVAFFVAHGTLDIALQTWISLPPRIVRTVPHETFSVLASGMRWFFHRFVGLITLAIFGIVTSFRRRPDTFALGALAWTISGIGVILVQVTSWFQYQWLLLEVPIGIFAALGADALVDVARSSQRNIAIRIASIIFVCICAILLPATLVFHIISPLVHNRFALEATSREAYRDAVSPVYAALRADARYVAPGSGALYVFGDPTFYVVANRLQPITLNGSSIRLFLPEQWTELEHEFDVATPLYVYISHGVSFHSQMLSTLLAKRYHVTRKGKLGDLYVRLDGSALPGGTTVTSATQELRLATNHETIRSLR